MAAITMKTSSRRNRERSEGRLVLWPTAHRRMRSAPGAHAMRTQRAMMQRRDRGPGEHRPAKERRAAAALAARDALPCLLATMMRAQTRPGSAVLWTAPAQAWKRCQVDKIQTSLHRTAEHAGLWRAGRMCRGRCADAAGTTCRPGQPQTRAGLTRDKQRMKPVCLQGRRLPGTAQQRTRAETLQPGERAVQQKGLAGCPAVRG
jgi:hypothetical protein